MIDKMMAKYGYILTKENQYGAYYEKQGVDYCHEA